jgi:hypothetical protein
LLIVVCAPTIAVANDVFDATAAVLLSYHPPDSFVGMSDFKNPASIIACGARTPVLFWRIRMAASTFF